MINDQMLQQSTIFAVVLTTQILPGFPVVQFFLQKLDSVMCIFTNMST